MIQRIQTIWLLLSALFSGLLIPGRLLSFSGNNGEKYFVCFSGLFKSDLTGDHLLTRLYPLSVIVLLILGLSVLALFLFKSRKIQKIFTLTIILFSFSLIIMAFYSSCSIINNFSAEFVPTAKISFLLIIPLSAFLAYRGISKDESLIKSYDRLR